MQLILQALDGNSDSSTPVTNIFETPFQTKKLTIQPLGFNGWPSMRFEFLKSCTSAQGNIYIYIL